MLNGSYFSELWRYKNALMKLYKSPPPLNHHPSSPCTELARATNCHEYEYWSRTRQRPLGRQHDTYLGCHGGNRCVDTTVLLVLRPSPPLYIGIQFCGRRPAKSLLSLGPSPVQRGNESRLAQLAILVTDWLGTLWLHAWVRGTSSTVLQCILKFVRVDRKQVNGMMSRYTKC